MEEQVNSARVFNVVITTGKDSILIEVYPKSQWKKNELQVKDVVKRHSVLLPVLEEAAWDEIGCFVNSLVEVDLLSQYNAIGIALAIGSLIRVDGDIRRMVHFGVQG